MSGLEKLRAFPRALTQNPVSNAVETSQARTYRLNQSMIATK
jgi:hypothetical protein